MCFSIKAKKKYICNIHTAVTLHWDDFKVKMAHVSLQMPKKYVPDILTAVTLFWDNFGVRAPRVSISDGRVPRKLPATGHTWHTLLVIIVLSCHLESEKKPAKYFPVFWFLCAHIFTATVSIADT